MSDLTATAAVAGVSSDAASFPAISADAQASLLAARARGTVSAMSNSSSGGVGAGSGRTLAEQPIAQQLAQQHLVASSLLSSRTASLAAQLAASEQVLRDIQAALAAENQLQQRQQASVYEFLAARAAGSATSSLPLRKPQIQSVPGVQPLPYKQHPLTAHVFLPPPRGMAPSCTPHAAALPSGMQPTPATPAASTSHPASSPLQSPLSVATPLGSPSTALPRRTYDPTAYAAACARVFGGMPLHPSTVVPSASPAPVAASPLAATTTALGSSLPSSSSNNAASGRGGLFGQGLLSDGGPNIADSFQVRMGRALADQRAAIMQNEASEQLQQSQPPLSSPAPSPLASPSSASFAATHSRLPYQPAVASSPGLLLSQLQSSPLPSSGNNNISSSQSSSALARGLADLTSSLGAFQHEILGQQVRAARARALALDDAEVGCEDLGASLELEVRNCSSAQRTFQASVEQGIVRWEGHYSQPWNTQLDELEQAVAALHARMDELEGNHDVQRLEATRVLQRALMVTSSSSSSSSAAADADEAKESSSDDARSGSVASSLASARRFFEHDVLPPAEAFHTRLLLKVDRMASQLRQVYNQSHEQSHGTQNTLTNDVEKLRQLRLVHVSSMESDLVSEIGSIRQQLHTQQLERERGDQQLAQALREATVRLQRGLELLHS